MAILTLDELATAGKKMERAQNGAPIEYNKTTLFAVLQVIENQREVNRGPMTGLVNAASGSFVFSEAQKDTLINIIDSLRVKRGGIL